MFEGLVARLKRRRKTLSDEELAEQERLRRQAEEALRRAEADAAQQRGRIESGGGGTGGNW